MNYHKHIHLHIYTLFIIKIIDEKINFNVIFMQTTDVQKLFRGGIFQRNSKRYRLP